MATFKSRPASDENLANAKAAIDRLLTLPEKAFADDHAYVASMFAEHRDVLTSLDMVGVLHVQMFFTGYQKSICASPEVRGNLITASDAFPWELAALAHVIRADKELAIAANIFPSPIGSPYKVLMHALGCLRGWQVEFLWPEYCRAIESGMKLDLCTRGDRVVALVRELLNCPDVMPGRAYRRYVVEWALTDLNHRHDGDPYLTEDEIRQYCAIAQATPTTDVDLVFRGRDGTLRYGQRQFRDKVKPVIGKLLRRKQQRRRLTLRAEALGPHSDDAQRDRESQSLQDVTLDYEPEDRRKPGPDQDAAAGEVREAFTTHPEAEQLQRVLQTPSISGNLGDEAMFEIQPLLKLIANREDPALKAEIVYRWLTGHAGRFDGGRSLVGDEYGVTLRQMQQRSDSASRDLLQVSRRPS